MAEREQQREQREQPAARTLVEEMDSMWAAILALAERLGVEVEVRKWWR